MRILLLFCLVVFYVLNSDAQVINWGTGSNAIQSESINTCYEDGSLVFEFTNVSVTLVDATIEIQLDTGILYVESSIDFKSSVSATVVEDDLSNLNRPTFLIGNIASGETIRINIDRIAGCEAMALKIGGSTFFDVVHIYESGTEVTYANGIANGTVNYEIFYASLSLTSVITSPPVNNLGNASTRALNITNGSFGAIDEFYYAEVFNAGDLTLSNFRINPSGINYSIPASNISIVGDSVIVHFTSNEIAAIDGSGGSNGNGNSLFEEDEIFILEYEVSPNNCGASNTIPSELLAWFGCTYGDRCQVVENAASLGLVNATPSISLSNALKPRLDFCDTVTYSVSLTNTSSETTPTGGAFASDVTAFLGFRANTSAISTLAAVTQWGTGRHNTKHFTNHQLNGHPVTLPTIAGLFGTTLPYLPPDYFTSDPDGPGGLTDVDGDGFYDDLPKDSVLVISYGVYLTPKDRACGLGRFDYIGWEHIAADISWFNQCGSLMSPLRQEFNYTNHIRDYLNSTFIDNPSDIIDGQNFDIGIRPHLFTSIFCNGANGSTGAGVDWITQVVLPPGLSMASGYDPTTYLVSNDTVRVIGKYSYDWTNFPLEFSCADWDGSQPVTLPISTYYICGDGTDICYEEEVHCVDITMNPHCGVSCVGVNTLNFSTERVSESWTDNTQTTLVDLDDPDIVTNFVYPFDTVLFYAEGVFTDTMSDNLFLRITFSPESGGNIFSFEEGTVEIVDIDGQYNGGTTNYKFPLILSPTINNLGGNDYEMIFDLSSYKSSIDPNYLYGQNTGGPPNYDGDSIKLSARVVISNSMAFYAPWKVNNLRSEYFIYDDAKEEVLCNSWGSELNYEYPYSYAGANTSASSGCNSVSKLFYLTHQALTGDDHPNEYRPPYHIDSAIINIPVGWDLVEVKWIDNSVMSSSDYELKPNRDLILRRPAGYKDYDKRNTFYPRFTVEIIPTCEANEGANLFDYTVYFKDFTYLTDSTSHVPRTSSDNDGRINYNKPTMTVTPINQTAVAYEDTVQWTLKVCNSTSDMDVDYNWLLLENIGNLIQIDSVVDETGGSSILLNSATLPSGETYVQIGDLNQGECKDIVIYSSFSSCEKDTLNIAHGWACNGYPTGSDIKACDAKNEVYILPQEAQISATISELADTPIDPHNPGNGNWGSSSIDMCSEFPAELIVLNSQPAYLYDVSVSIEIPSNGNGVRYVPGSATIELEGVDPMNVPRAIGVAAEAALIAASNNGDPFWNLSLADIDPTNFGNGEPFSGTLNAANNQFILRWEMESTCDLVSGDFFNSTIYGNDPCGSPAEGSGEQLKGYPINLNGVVAPYFSFITIDIDPSNQFEGCNDTKTVDVELLLSGGTTGATDTLNVILPEGLEYGGNYICNTPGLCPTYVSSTIVNGEEVLYFKYPSGINGSINFSFDVNTNDRGSCFGSEVIRFLSQTTLTGLACGMTSCASTVVITGDEEIPVSLEKPIFSVNFNSLSTNTAASPFIYNYDLDLTNTGSDTDADVILEFYCLNAAGDDIQGSAVGRDTLTSTLTNGSTINLTGNFSASCDPTQGIAVLVVPEYDNCYCSALDSMSDKSPGLTEIPHDTITYCKPPVFPTTLTTCDNSNGAGEGVFFLHDANPFVTSEIGVSISYHPTLLDAENDTNILLSPYTSSDNIIYVRVVRLSNGCYHTAPITLDVGLKCDENCNNGVDEDGDGLIDCNDSDCLCCEAKAATLILLKKE